MKRLTGLVLGACLSAAFIAGSASASVLYDQNLPSPDGTYPDGWFNGTGPVNGGFTVSNNGSVSIAMRAIERQSPTVIHTATGQYNVPAGAQPSSPSHADWNWEFSINLCGTSECGLTLADVLPSSTITVTDLNTGHTNTVSLSSWVDDSVWDTAKSVGSGADPNNFISHPNAYIAQNSENPVFTDFPLNGFYNEAANDIYRFSINLNDAQGNFLGADSMDVIVGDGKYPAPEPASFALMGAGLAGAGFMVRRKKKATPA